VECHIRFFFFSSPPPPSIFPHLPPPATVLALLRPIRPFWPGTDYIPASRPGKGQIPGFSGRGTARSRPFWSGKGQIPSSSGSLRHRLCLQLPTGREKKKNEREKSERREERESFHFRREKKILTWKFHIRL
jgi:hypothetical protein